MVQSIWLQFDNKELDNHVMIKWIKKIVKSKYKCYSFVDEKDKFTYRFKFIDCNQFISIIEKLNLKVDDHHQCDCGCLSTDLERLIYFIDLEFNYGKVFKELDYIYFRLGRNIYSSIDPFNERLMILRYMLEDIKTEFDKVGIVSKLDLSDCDERLFDNYKPGES